MSRAGRRARACSGSIDYLEVRRTGAQDVAAQRIRLEHHGSITGGTHEVALTAPTRKWSTKAPLRTEPGAEYYAFASASDAGWVADGPTWTAAQLAGLASDELLVSRVRWIDDEDSVVETVPLSRRDFETGACEQR